MADQRPGAQNSYTLYVETHNTAGWRELDIHSGKWVRDVWNVMKATPWTQRADSYN